MGDSAPPKNKVKLKIKTNVKVKKCGANLVAVLCHYRLEQPYIAFTLGSWRGFSVISPPNLNGSE